MKTTKSKQDKQKPKTILRKKGDMMAHKKDDLKGGFDKLPDGIYIAVLEATKLDLTNDYGARVNLTFTLPTKRKLWVDIKENPKSKKGPLAMAFFQCNKLGIGTMVQDELGDEFETEEFLETVFEQAQTKEGHYYELELKTNASVTTGKEYQNASIVDEATQKQFDQFEMPSAPKEDFSEPSTLNSEDTIPF